MVTRCFRVFVALSALCQPCWPSICKAEIPADGEKKGQA
jgi:hypothetical protein